VIHRVVTYSDGVECVFQAVVLLLSSIRRPSIFQFHLCILCDYNKYLCISSISGCLYIHTTSHSLILNECLSKGIKYEDVYWLLLAQDAVVGDGMASLNTIMNLSAYGGLCSLE
jgi:hypothetical protein